MCLSPEGGEDQDQSADIALLGPSNVQHTGAKGSLELPKLLMLSRFSLLFESAVPG